jgi:hypothetical protein
MRGRLGNLLEDPAIRSANKLGIDPTYPSHANRIIDIVLSHKSAISLASTTGHEAVRRRGRNNRETAYPMAVGIG